MVSVSAKRILLDCRFIGLGGGGKVTELLLRGLRQLQPPGHWILWGPPEVSAFQWNGARFQESRSSPIAMWGQKDLLRLPPNDIAVYMHQIRPLRTGRALTVIHDTIPLHFGNPLIRQLKKLFLLSVARLTSLVLTDSQYSAHCLRRDLGIPAEKIRVLRLPIDDEMVARIRTLREVLSPQDVILFVGRFATHKNLERLVAAFARTEFRKNGGILHLVGGTRREVADLQKYVMRSGVDGVLIEGACSQDRLEELYATSRLLVLPSLEEGFGLPAQEAASAGLRISVSDGGALREIFGDIVKPFPAHSVEIMTAALDRDVTGPPPRGLVEVTPIDYAEAVIKEVLQLTSEMKHV